MRIETPDDWIELDVAGHTLPPTFPLVLPVCRELRIAEVVDRHCPMKWYEHVTHGEVVEFLVLHLLQSAHRQPLYKLEEWAAEHHIEALYDCPAEAFNDDRVGHALDALAEQVAVIEVQVVTEALRRYQVDARQIHWDLKHVTFSGAHERSELICRGHGAGQLHAKQLQVSLHVTGEGGVPVRHEVLAGNTNQTPLAAALLADLQQRLPRSDLLVISDRAGFSYENLVAYRKAKAHFVAPLTLTPAQERALATVPQEAFIPLAYHSLNAPGNHYSYYPTTLWLTGRNHSQPLPVKALYIHSTGLEARVKETRDNAITKALTRLAQIEGYLNQRRYARAQYARKQLANAGPAAAHGIVHYELLGADGELCLRFWVDEAARAHAAARDGRYVLVFDEPGASPEEIFGLYKQQNTIEARFRNFNSDLAVHPVWLQLDRRIRALLLVFVLALIVYTLLELRAHRVGLRGPYYPKMTTREMLFRFSHLRVQEVRIRGRPPLYQLCLSTAQQAILHALGLPDPIIYLIHAT